MIEFNWDEERNCVVRTRDTHDCSHADYVGSSAGASSAMWIVYNNDKTGAGDHKGVIIGGDDYPDYERDIAELVLRYKRPIRILDPGKAPYNEHSVPYSVNPVTEYEAAVHKFIETPVDENGDYMDFTECDDEDLKVSDNLTVLVDGSIAVAAVNDPVIIHKGYSLYDISKNDKYLEYIITLYVITLYRYNKFEACK